MARLNRRYSGGRDPEVRSDVRIESDIAGGMEARLGILLQAMLHDSLEDGETSIQFR